MFPVDSLRLSIRSPRERAEPGLSLAQCRREDRDRRADNAWIELRYTHVELSSRNIKPHDVPMVRHIRADAAYNWNR